MAAGDGSLSSSKLVWQRLNGTKKLIRSIVSVPVGVLTILALWFTLPKTAWNEPAAQIIGKSSLIDSLRRLDVLGAFLMVGTIVLLTTGLQQTALDYAWSSAMVLGLIVPSVPVAAAFFAWQWWATTRLTNPEPVFPWRLCRNRLSLGLIMYVRSVRWTRDASLI
jgi:hypothetical protein